MHTPGGRKETVQDFLNIYLQAIGMASVLGAIVNQAFRVMEVIWKISQLEASFLFSSMFLMGITQIVLKNPWNCMDDSILMSDHYDEIFRTDLTLPLRKRGKNLTNAKRFSEFCIGCFCP